MASTTFSWRGVGSPPPSAPRSAMRTSVAVMNPSPLVSTAAKDAAAASSVRSRSGMCSSLKLAKTADDSDFFTRGFSTGSTAISLLRRGTW